MLTVEETKDIHIQEYFLLFLSTEQSISLKLKWLQEKDKEQMDSWTIKNSQEQMLFSQLF